MVVMYGTGDGEARELFNERDIGDVDRDGALEFIDGWGRPINYIRWPAGYARRSALMSGDGQADHDPFDRFRRDTDTALVRNLSNYPGAMATSLTYLQQRNANAASAANPTGGNPPQFFTAFRLTPLIMSSGADGESGVFAVSTNASEVYGDPYAPTKFTNSKTSETVMLQLGTPYDDDDLVAATTKSETEKDNITNHDAAR